MSNRKLIMHLGAHKTASTYIQDTLALNTEASAAKGVAYWPREKFRVRANFAMRREKARQSSWKGKLNARFADRIDNPTEIVRQMLDVDYDVTLSEENLLGNSHECFSGALYPGVAANLSALKPALPDREIEVLLSLRSYQTFMSSLFIEALKNGAVITPDQARQSQSYLKGGWSSLIRQIQSALPEAKIVVWKYEDFASLEDTILSHMSGLEPAAIQKPDGNEVLPSPSAEAIASLLEAPFLPGRVERMLRVRAIRSQFPRSDKTKRFSLWEPDEESRLAQDYLEEIETIRSSGIAEFIS